MTPKTCLFYAWIILGSLAHRVFGHIFGHLVCFTSNITSYMRHNGLTIDVKLVKFWGTFMSPLHPYLDVIFLVEDVIHLGKILKLCTSQLWLLYVPYRLNFSLGFLNFLHPVYVPTRRNLSQQWSNILCVKPNTFYVNPYVTLCPMWM